MSRSWTPATVVAALACVVAIATGAAPARAGVGVPVFRDGYGLHVRSEHQLDSRLLALSVSTAALEGTPSNNPAVNGAAGVQVLLPSGYRQHPHRRYPVLYLLPGTRGRASDWTVFGGAEQTTSGLPLIVVMPDIDLAGTGGGWCTNWYNGGAYGPPEWEMFHIDQLVPWIDRNLRTIASRDGRAIAGLSQGGFCSTSYPARHPDMFIATLSFSGAPDIAFDHAAWGPSTAIINFTETVYDHVLANSMFGPRSTEEINYATHDPATLANNLRGLNIMLYTGDGQRGPLDPGPPSSFASTIETLAHQDTLAFHARLQALGIRSYLDDYGPGTHSFPYWARDLEQSIGRVMSAFAYPPRAPAEVTYTLADTHYSVFGWSVSMHRRAEEFSTLEHAGGRGFALSGSGSATVLTPEKFRAGARYRITLRGRRIHRTEIVRADHNGKLRIQVPLGPPNPFQEDTPQAIAAGTKVYTSTVGIEPLAGSH